VLKSIYTDQELRKIQKKDSDWDLLILLNSDQITSDIENAFTSPLYDIEFETGGIIIPMIYSQKGWDTNYRITPFYKNVMKEGYLI